MNVRDASRNPIRILFGVVLVLAWCAETVIWVASTVYLAERGHWSAVVTAALTLVLLVLLAGMEGLEVAVIDRWRDLFPGGTSSSLAGWLSARQLFVALIVTGATLLSHRSTLVVPALAGEFADGVWTAVFDVTWIGLTVLWFGQILPKALAANNPERYLKLFRAVLFPAVAFVRFVGISQPGEWAASLVARATRWRHQEEPLTPASAPTGESGLVQGWSAVISFRPGAPTSQRDNREGN